MIDPNKVNLMIKGFGSLMILLNSFGIKSASDGHKIVIERGDGYKYLCSYCIKDTSTIKVYLYRPTNITGSIIK